MKKTELQQLIEQLESMKNNHPHKNIFDEGIHEGLRCAIREAKHYIDPEREQIEEAFIQGTIEGDSSKGKSSEEYYKDTYQ